MDVGNLETVPGGPANTGTTILCFYGDSHLLGSLPEVHFVISFTGPARPLNETRLRFGIRNELGRVRSRHRLALGCRGSCS